MGPSSDRDAVVGPPPNASPSSSGQGQSSPDLGEKYRKLKRPFLELEEESNSETYRSGERNVRMREARDYLLEKMQEMEQKGQINPNNFPAISLPMEQASSSPLPRTLVNPKARASFEANLRQAAEEDNLDDDANLLLPSRRPGPQSRRRKEEGRRDREGKDSRNSGTRHGSASAGGSQGSDSPRGRHSPSSDGDVEMADGQDASHSHSRGASGVQPLRGQPERENGSIHPSRNAGEPPARRETRPTRQSRGGRNDGTDIAAVAAAAVAAQSSTPTLGGTNDPSASAQPDVQMADNTKTNAPKQVKTPSSTLAHALGPTSDSSSKDRNMAAPAPAQPHMQHAPSMESILKVAEAAVAAQNAAKLAAANSNVDPNLDPTLFSDAAQPPSKNGNGASSSTHKLPSVNTKATNASNTNATASSSTVTPVSATPTPTSSLSSNPYLSLSTNLLPRANSGSSTPTGHPMLMPYLFYPPGTPVTPNSPNPAFPMPYNPYYYMAPGPNGMYPPPPANFAPPPQQRPPPEPQKAKPKRLKAHTVTTKSFSIPMVPRDKNGKPMLPLNVGIMTVINLGEVCMREHFHTERYIFPVGYEVTRRYLSTLDPSIEVVYHCTILDGGDGPKFQIIPSDRPDKPIIAGTATGAWSNIVKQANAIRNRQHSNSVSGPDFFGLGQNTIKHLIQELPNADRLRDYVWQNFVEGGPLGGRHAAVIPALPEEYDASMPIGAYYPKRDVTVDPNVPRGLSHYPQHIIAQAEAQRAQKLAAQAQGQAAATAGPSVQPVPAPTPTPQPLPTTGPVGASGTLNIQEYQPQPGGQLVSQSADKRTTRSSNATPSSTSASASGRTTRSVSRGDQQQQQHPPQNLPPVNGTGAPASGTDSTTPTTFAEIMNAYPAPAVPATDPTSASG